MPAVEKLSIALTSEFVADVRAAVEAGEYASVSEVVRDALRTWRQQRAERAAALSELRNLWRAGIESGDGGAFDPAKIKRLGREKLAKARGS